MNALHENIKELEKDRRLLSERNQLVHSLDRDLAVKEDLIHKLLAENEQAQILASQVSIPESRSQVSLTTLCLPF